MRYVPVVLLISTGCAAIASAAPVPLPPLPPPPLLPNDLAVKEQHDNSANQSGDTPNDLAARDSDQSGTIAPRSISPLVVIGILGGCALIILGAGALALWEKEKGKRKDEQTALCTTLAAARDTLAVDLEAGLPAPPPPTHVRGNSVSSRRRSDSLGRSQRKSDSVGPSRRRSGSFGGQSTNSGHSDAGPSARPGRLNPLATIPSGTNIYGTYGQAGTYGSGTTTSGTAGYRP